MTTLGTNSRIGQWFYDVCPVCGLDGGSQLVYATDEETGLVCATHYREWSAANPDRLRQICDRCGSDGNVWRDPVSRKNEYLCVICHGKSGQVFLNRWADFVRESKPLGIRSRPKCAVADNNCRGEVKWRSGANASLCNRHAGKEGVGPNG